MGASLDEFALVEDADEIGIADGGKAVGDDEGGAVGAEAIEGLLDKLFSGVVEGGGGLVEQEEGRVFEKGAGDGEALFFASGKADAALTRDGVELLGKIADEAFGVGGVEGAQSSASVASCLARVRFSRMVVLKRNGSWVTKPVWSRSHSLEISEMGLPSNRIFPEVGS